MSLARRPISLRRYLLLGILLPVGLFVLVNAFSLYRQTLQAVNTAYDRTLLASAKSMGELLDEDQPVGVDVINSLITAYQQGGHAIVAPVYDGVRGNPVIFDRRLFPELMMLTGDRGARDLIDRHTDALIAVPFAFPPPVDIDTQEDLQKLQRPS